MSSKINIIIVGKPGNGKSATGNTILQIDAFQSKRSPEEVTTECCLAQNVINNTTYNVVDTPGIVKNGRPSLESALEVQRSLEILEVNRLKPHLFILILSITNRFTDNDILTIELRKVIFGDEMLERTIIVFTNKYSLGEMTLSEFCVDSPDLVKSISEFKKRKIAIDNSDSTGRDELYTAIGEIRQTHNEYVADKMKLKATLTNYFEKTKHSEQGLPQGINTTASEQKLPQGNDNIVIGFIAGVFATAAFSIFTKFT